jgi:tyrosinase
MMRATYRSPGGASRPPTFPKAALLIGVSLAAAFGQGIRKNYTEMTTEEKNALVSAFQTLGDASNSLVRDLANYHSSHFSAASGGIHQATLESQNNFHAWHRYASYELEQEMQKINRHITLPYWDWTVNRLTTDALWDPAFLGGFNARWSLNRTLGSGASLPTATDVAGVQSITSFWVGSGTSGAGYSQQVENATPVHNNPHLWVGGTMAGGGSPLDPIFWFHHNNIDRLWQLWEDQEPAVKTFHTRTTLARYDGTYHRQPDNLLLPAVDPDAITDSRTLGVFYAGSGLAVLDNYTVANRTHNPEQFTYQYAIQTRNFVVPAGKTANIRSATSIELAAGTTVNNGSLTMEITPAGSILSKEATVARPEPPAPQARAEGDFHYRLAGNGRQLGLEFPGWIAKAEDIRGEIWDLTGKRTEIPLTAVDGVYLIHGLTFDLGGVRSSGLHFFRIVAGKETFTGQVPLMARR